MPFDFTTPKPELKPFTLEDFAAFCRTKPADEEYCGYDPNQCAIAQYTQARGGGRKSSEYYIRNARMFDGGCEKGGLHPLHLAALPIPHTFGAALHRAEQAAAMKMKDSP